MTTPIPPAVNAQTLAAASAFAHLSSAARAGIAGLFHGRRYSPGDYVIRQHEAGQGVFFVISGSVRVTFFASTGREVSFRDLDAGEMFGELSALDGEPRSAEVIARSETFVAWLSVAHFRKLLREVPDFSDYVVRRLVRLVRLLSERVIEFTTLDVAHRIRAEILRLAYAAGVDGNRSLLMPPPRHIDIANRVSTHREAVTRELNALKKMRVLGKAQGAMVVADVGTLERLTLTEA
jgi:CRP-like cAMP-binding protein